MSDDKNKYLLLEAVKKGIYKYVDYKKTPIEYCGMELNNTILDNNVLL